MSKPFKFRLAPLLDIRQRAEDERKQALGRVLGKLNEQTARAQRYEQMIRQEHHSLRGGELVGELDVRRLAHHRRYVNGLMRSMIETLCERATTWQQSQQSRAELAEAVKQRKVLEKLRDRRRAEWQAEFDRGEANELDEMGIIATRRKGEGERP